MCLAFLHAKYQDTCFGGGKCGPVPERIRLFLSTRKSLVLVPRIALSTCRASSYNYRFVHDKNIRYFRTLSKIGCSVLPCWAPTDSTYYETTVTFTSHLLQDFLSSCPLSNIIHVSTHLAIHPFKTECYISGQWGRCGCYRGGCITMLHHVSDFFIKSCIQT